MRLAIVGSRCLAGDPEARAIIRRELAAARSMIEVVISGGATGVDTMAREEAERLGLRVIEHLPVLPPGRRATWADYKPRDLLIAQDCTHLIRIVGACSRSYGSGWTRDQAAKLGKPTREFVVGPMTPTRTPVPTDWLPWVRLSDHHQNDHHHAP